MATRIRITSNVDHLEIQRSVEKFVEENKEKVNLIDIQFSTCYDNVKATVVHTVMMWFEDKHKE